MRDRNEEYWDMIRELAQPPKKLEGTVERARRRARRARLTQNLLKPAASVAAAAACFVLMVNAFPTFALACSALPIVRELTAAVAFSPSLSAAVAHEYVQYIGQTKTVDGVTVDLGYAIVDKTQAVFFYSVDGGRSYTSPDLTDGDGNSVGGYGVSSYNSGEPTGKDRLDSVTISFMDGVSLPEQFTMAMYFMPESEPEQATAIATAAPAASLDSAGPDIWRDPREDPGVVCVRFDVSLDLDRVVEPVTVPVDRWVELDGQRILVDRLEYSPTRTVLYLGEDAANTAWLRSLKFWFEGLEDKRYDDTDGSVSAIGTEGSRSFLTYYFQSFYYDRPKELTLCIDKAEWLDKDMPHVSIDLTTGESTGLPKGVEVGDIVRTGSDVRVQVRSPLVRAHFAQSFEHIYWDPEGGEHSWNRASYTQLFDDDGKLIAIQETLYLDGYPWDSVELELSYSSVSEYGQPVRVPLMAQD